MKRLVLALALLAASPLLAFDEQPVKPSIAILRIGTIDHDVEKAVRNALRDELRSRGFEAYTDDSTLEDVEQTDDRRADYYVEIISGADVNDYGGVGVSGRHADVALGVVVSRVATDVQIYDGATLSLLATESSSKKSTAVVPTAVGVGGRSLFAVIALPFIERAQLRSVARATAKELAARVTDVVQGE